MKQTFTNFDFLIYSFVLCVKRKPNFCQKVMKTKANNNFNIGTPLEIKRAVERTEEKTNK